MSEIADELARRASPQHLKARTKEVAVKTTMDLRDRTVRSPTALALIGGSFGAALGALLARRQRRAVAFRAERFEPEAPLRERAVETRESLAAQGAQAREAVESRAAEAKERLAERGEQAREAVQSRAAETREAVQSRVADTRERLAERGEQAKEAIGTRAAETRDWVAGKGEALRSRAAGLRERVPTRGAAKGWYQRRMNDEPWIFALGALALGAAAAFLFPITRREHETVAPLKERARGEIDTVTGKLEQRLQGPAAEEEEREAAPATGEAIPTTLPGQETTAPGHIIH